MRRSARSLDQGAPNAPRSASSRSVRWPASTRWRSTRCRHCCSLGGGAGARG
jgi:hypothetical protein